MFVTPFGLGRLTPVLVAMAQLRQSRKHTDSRGPWKAFETRAIDVLYYRDAHVRLGLWVSDTKVCCVEVRGGAVFGWGSS
jgi:hypothetical protein